MKILKKERNNSLVSIVTPSFNTSNFIEENILSVKNQNYSNIEHIIFDGNSTDETIDILSKYTHLKWTSEPDQGQSDALNKGFRLAQGSIIGWLNSDDTYEPNTISTIVSFFEENPSIDMVCSDINIIDQDSNKIGIAKGQEFNLYNIIYRNPIKQPSVFFRKIVIDKLIGLDPKLNYVMDRELWLRIIMNKFSVQYLDKYKLANFRLCKGTKTFEETPQFRQEWYEVLKEAFKSNYFDKVSKKFQQNALYSNRSAYYLSLSQKSVNNTKQFIKFSLMAVFYDKKILINKGFYKLFILGLMGYSRNEYERFI